MNAVIRGRAAIWGIHTEAGDTHAAGIIVDQGYNLTGDEDVVLDDEGFVIAKAYFNDQNQCDINIICESTTAMPDRGDDIQIAGVACMVDSAELKWDQKGWKKFAAKATKYMNLA